MTIAIATGSRKLEITADWWPMLDVVRERHGITTLWHGDAPGVDQSVAVWARHRGLTVEAFPAPWELWKRARLNVKAAGMRRNADMLAGLRGYRLGHPVHDPKAELGVVCTERVEGEPSVLLRFPGHQGTRGMTRLARAKGLALEWLAQEPAVINRWHFSGAGDELPPHTISIMRGESPLGNPFKIGAPHPYEPNKLVEPDQCLEFYRDWLLTKIRERDPAVLRALSEITAKSHLKCACLRPNGEGLCHGQVIVRAWRWIQSHHR